MGGQSALKRGGLQLIRAEALCCSGHLLPTSQQVGCWLFEIVGFARQRQIAKIVAGRPTRHRWGDFLSKSPVDDLVRLSGEIDVLVTTGAPGEHKEAPILVQPKPFRWPDYEIGLIYVAVATGVCFLMYPYFDLPNLIMVYLLAVMGTAVQCGRGPAILNALLGVLAFDFSFVPPRWSFTVEDAKYVVTFVVMFLVAVVIGHLTSLIKRQAEAARLQERQTAVMHALSRQLASSRGVEKILQVAVQHISAIFQCEVVALLPDETQRLHAVAGDLDSVFHQHILKEMSVAQWTYDKGRIAGWGPRTPRAPRISTCRCRRPTSPWGCWLYSRWIRNRPNGCCRSNCASASWNLWPRR